MEGEEKRGGKSIYSSPFRFRATATLEIFQQKYVSLSAHNFQTELELKLIYDCI